MTMKMDNTDILGTFLASRLNLNSRYFSNIFNSKRRTLNSVVDVKKLGGLIFVSVPFEAKRYIDDISFVPTKLTSEDDDRDFEYILELTKDTRIGFWK